MKKKEELVNIPFSLSLLFSSSFIFFHTKDPTMPPMVPNRITGTTEGDTPSAFPNRKYPATSAAANATPIANPPSVDAAHPKAVIPPFVPVGTLRRVVTRRGADLLRTPSSEAQVSPLQHA